MEKMTGQVYAGGGERCHEGHVYGYVHFVEFMNCVAEFLLYVADAAEREERWWLVHRAEYLGEVH